MSVRDFPLASGLDCSGVFGTDFPFATRDTGWEDVVLEVGVGGTGAFRVTTMMVEEKGGTRLGRI